MYRVRKLMTLHILYLTSQPMKLTYPCFVEKHANILRVIWERLWVDFSEFASPYFSRKKKIKFLTIFNRPSHFDFKLQNSTKLKLSIRECLRVHFWNLRSIQAPTARFRKLWTWLLFILELWKLYQINDLSSRVFVSQIL